MKRTYLIILIAVSILITGCSFPKVNIFGGKPEPLKEYTLEGIGADKILLIPVEGMISDVPKKEMFSTTQSVVERVVEQLKKAQNDKKIKVVLFKINSPGGTITASDILYHEISDYKAKTGSKIVISMMDIATSGAYYISLPADEIMAHPTTITGSVGVIAIRPKVKGLMDKIGLAVDVQKVGKYKDMGSPFRDTGKDEKQLLQNTMNDFGERFLGIVKKHRKLTGPAVTEISTARIFLADEALQTGLIDKIGYINDAIKDSKKIAGIPENARVVVYRRVKFREDSYYKAAEATSENINISAINIELPEILGARAGFYYLWPGAIFTE
jgi:protease IV